MSRQYISGAGFSLEHLTDNVPPDGRYYLLRDGNAAEGFDTLEEAQGAYAALCLAYWAGMLVSDDVATRVRAARGLLRRDRKHRVALETLAVHGDNRERHYAAESLRRLDVALAAVAAS